MDNPEELLHSLDEFAKLKPKNIPRELEDYLMYVARTGDPVYQWPVVKCLFREKLLNVITEFYETTPTLDLTPSPNVDPFNYENMKTVLLERLEAFSNAPFTVQRLCELLTTPRKEYNRPDKFMRAIEKNILVVSTREPGSACRPDSALSEPIQNGVSEPPDTPPSQPISSDENNVAKTLNEESPKESVENHIAVQATSSQDLNHVDSEQAGPSPKVNDALEERKEEEVSETIATELKETTENVVASTSVTEEVKNVPVASAATVVLEVNPADSISHPEESGLVNQPSNDSLLVSKEVEDVTASSSSPESTSVRDADEETYSGSVLPEKNESVSETENSEAKEAACDRLAVEDQLVLEPVLEVSAGDASHSLKDQVDVEENETCASVDEEPKICPVKEEQAADSTALDSDEPKDVPSSEDAAPSHPESDVEKLSSEGSPKSDKEVDTSKILDSSEATPAHKKVETEAKQVVTSGKSDEDTSISSTEATDEEAMEVDESSNQPSEAADSEAMDVAVEDEPMEVCEENPGGEVVASSQEIGQ